MTGKMVVLRKGVTDMMIKPVRIETDPVKVGLYLLFKKPG
jgi:hypothetical protein